jgi:ubiquinone biosynthesis protein Coq4
MLALWRVTRDLQNTYEAGIVEIAFARWRLARRFARWDRVIADICRDPGVREAFEQRCPLGWIDVDALAKLPRGTLGRVFATHLRANGLDPNLIQIPVEDDVSYLLQHLYQTHDVWHVVSGCGNDEPGEFAVGGFYAAQLGAPFFAFLLGLAFFNTAFAKPLQLRPRLEGLAKGYLAGQMAKPLFGTDWTELWAVPLEEVRRDLGLDPHPAYAGKGVLHEADGGRA